MIALTHPFNLSSFDQEIQEHPAWLGKVSGLEAEKMLREKKPYHYVLRAGEFALEYYVTFAHADGTVRHQPFVITIAQEGWYYENGGVNGPYTEATIGEVIYQIMHCEEDECEPLINFAKK